MNNTNNQVSNQSRPSQSSSTPVKSSKETLFQRVLRRTKPFIIQYKIWLLIIIALVILISIVLTLSVKEGWIGKEKTEPIPPTTEQYNAYTNTVYNYSIQYPKNWILDSANLTKVQFREKDKTYTANKVDTYAIAITINSQPQTLSASEVADQFKNTTTSNTVSNIKINGVKAAQINNNEETQTIIVNDKKQYNIILIKKYDTNVDMANLQAAYDQIVQSIKFKNYE